MQINWAEPRRSFGGREVSQVHVQEGFGMELYQGICLFLGKDLSQGKLGPGRELVREGYDSNMAIVEELALPPVKIHCSVLAEDAIKAAIRDYQTKNGIEVAEVQKAH